MKCIALLLTLLVIGLGSLQAQDLDFGVKAGLNLADLKGDFENGGKARTAFHLGAVAELSVAEQFAVQAELLYSGQGAVDEDDSDEKWKIDYLTIPVLAKFYVAEGLSLEAGPQLGILLKSEVEDDGETTDIKDITKSTDLGLALGLGYKLSGGLHFGARYYFGGDINDQDTSDIKVTNSVIQLSVGYFF